MLESEWDPPHRREGTQQDAVLGTAERHREGQGLLWYATPARCTRACPDILATSEGGVTLDLIQSGPPLTPVLQPDLSPGRQTLVIDYTSTSDGANSHSMLTRAGGRAYFLKDSESQKTDVVSPLERT